MPNLSPVNPLAALLQPNAQSDIKPRSTCSKSLASWPWWTGKPLPDDVTAAGLDEIDRELLAMLAPLPAPAILAEIEALRNLFGEWADRSPGQAKRLHKDWLDDLADTPGRFVVEACKRWRRAIDPPNKRPPHTAGELMASVQEDLGEIRFLARQSIKAREWLAKHAPQPAQRAG